VQPRLGERLCEEVTRRGIGNPDVADPPEQAPGVPVIDPPEGLGVSPRRREELGVRTRVVHHRLITLLRNS
jgi:hypothetical protein